MTLPWHGLLDLVAPPRCVACGDRSARLWCPGCRATAEALRIVPMCPRCGSGESRAHPCWEPRGPLASSLAAFAYTGPVAAAVVAGKARGAHGVWPRLGQLLAGAVLAGSADRSTLRQIDAVTWVTADAKRRRERGMDHARSLALPVAAALERRLVVTLSARPRGADQADLPIRARRALPDDVFEPVRQMEGARLLLVDDVLTTGATATAAARALERAGAEVHLAVLARAGRYELGRSGQPNTHP